MCLSRVLAVAVEILYLKARKYKLKYYLTCKMRIKANEKQTAIIVQKESDLFITLRAENQ